MSFDHLGLDTSIRRGLAKLQYSAPFPVQDQAIPLIIKGLDVVIQAQTGSGKTIAFLAPLIHRLLGKDLNSTSRDPHVLILVPTRELAMQICDRVVELVKNLKRTIRVRSVFGGVSINPQMLDLRGGCELLIGTPGRILDLISQNALCLDSLESLVLDEADRMLDEDFLVDMERIRGLIPQNRQTLLISATMTSAVKKVVANFLSNPSYVTIAANVGLELEINELVYLVSAEEKGPFLRELLERETWAKVLIFVGSAQRADKVIRKLENNGIEALALHGQKSQGARTEALQRFRTNLRVLVATDILARGIDLSGLPCVINYELPRSAKDYTHRIGRTGRAGQPGVAISLVNPDEEAHLGLIEKTIKRNLKRIQIRG